MLAVVAAPAVFVVTSGAQPACAAPGDAPTAPATRPAAGDVAAAPPATTPAVPERTFPVANISFAYSADSAETIPVDAVRRDATVRVRPNPSGTGYDVAPPAEGDGLSLEPLSAPESRPFTEAAIKEI